MGKKVKTGKDRRDKFYHLAKETGLRARSAFKLVQLNRKFNFLQQSKVCIDLCAAPGGWMQVAAQNMPPSSLIIGVDLVPIKPIKGCIGLVADITTERCRQMLRKEMKHLKADVVLHDGAPNVGTSWIQDAFTQASLVLKSLKLATEFLVEKGTFVTKVFRSRDYHALMWVFKQLFRKVQATKPTSSRNVSAEIFVVCQGFLAPDRIDPKMLDPKYVFEEIDDGQTLPDIFKDPKRKPRAEGYDDNVKQSMFTSITAEDFVKSDNHLDLLAMHNQIVFDDDSLIAKHPATTGEVRSLAVDLKVLGKKDFRTLIKWRQQMAMMLEEAAKLQRAAEGADGEGSEDEEEDEEGEGSEEDGESADSQDELETALAEAKAEEKAKLKRKRRLKAKEHRKLRERMALQMETPMDMAEDTNERILFNLKAVKNADQLAALDEGDMEAAMDPLMEVADEARPRRHITLDLSEEGSHAMMEEALERDYEQYLERKNKKKRVVRHHNKSSVIEARVDGQDADGDDADFAAAAPASVAADDEDEALENDTGLLVRSASKQRNTAAMWFAQNQFEDLDEDLDLDDEEEERAAALRKGATSSTNGGPASKRRKTAEELAKEYANEEWAEAMGLQFHADDLDESDGELDSADEFDDEDEDDMEGLNTASRRAAAVARARAQAEAAAEAGEDGDEATEQNADFDAAFAQLDQALGNDTKQLAVQAAVGDQVPTKKGDKGRNQGGGFEEVPMDTPESSTNRPGLDAAGLAMATEMIVRRKRREMIEAAYNRFAHNDDPLPMWFADEENPHRERIIPTSREMADEIKQRQREINARPLRRVLEAKARKKQRVGRALDKLTKQAEAIAENDSLTEREKGRQIQQLYKQYNRSRNQKRETTYVVAKRSLAAKRAVRPKGLTGRYQQVDQRMKADRRGMRASARRQKKAAKHRH